ncbi:Uncharacterised protein [uncultured archaeon]|nr:Uncharacterised protein [uncultured archaeon]
MQGFMNTLEGCGEAFRRLIALVTHFFESMQYRCAEQPIEDSSYCCVRPSMLDNRLLFGEHEG